MRLSTERVEIYGEVSERLTKFAGSEFEPAKPGPQGGAQEARHNELAWKISVGLCADYEIGKLVVAKRHDYSSTEGSKKIVRNDFSRPTGAPTG